MNSNFRICLRILLSLLGISPAFGQTITNFSPSLGSPGESIQIQGFGFFNAGAVTAVSFFNNKSASFFLASDNQINATIPTGATTGPVGLTRNGSTTFSPANFLVIGNGPYVTNFSPLLGNSGTPVQISGVHFTSITSVKFNGTAASFTQTVVDRVDATVPVAATTGPITITSASGTYITTNNFYLPPSVTGFSPSSGRVGTNVIIRGVNLTNATGVHFGSIAASSFTVTANTNVTVTVPIGAITGPVTVQTPGGSFVTVSNFVVLPAILGFNPPKGNVGTNVVVTGSGFNGSANNNLILKFNGTTASIIGTPSTTSITSTVPNGATSGPITVTTTNGVATSDVNFFLPPSISNVSPSSGPAGTPVVMTGANFTNATDVSFAGVSATFTVNNNTQISTVAPVGGATGRITVTTPGGIATNTALFFYPPVITTFTPASGLPGTNVTINGVNFTNATAVKFAGSNASFTIVNDGKITATVPTNAITGVITVTGPGGTAVSPSSFFIDTVSLTVQLLANYVSVTWPTNTIGFTLQDTTNLLSTNTAWLAVTSPPVTLQNGVNTYTNALNASARFFRLKK